MNFFKVTEAADFLRFDFHIPETSNAFSLAAARDLARLQKSYSKWKKPLLIGSLHPRFFCSGGNLSDYKKLKGKAPGLKINREITSILNSFGNWPVPKLALIEGDVLGGGLEWMARFDFRWSTPEACFAFWQRKIGLSSGWGGGRAWAGKIGEEPLRQLMLEGRLLSAGEALDHCLVDRVISAWKIREESELWAARMSGAAVQSLLKFKKANEQKIFSGLWMGPEHRNVLNKWKSRG